MTWSLREWRSVADKVGVYVEKVERVAHFLATNKTAVGLEKHLPDGAKIIASLGGLDKALQMTMGVMPHLGEAIALYNIYEALGGKPMDWGAPENVERANERDKLTG